MFVHVAPNDSLQLFVPEKGFILLRISSFSAPGSVGDVKTESFLKKIMYPYSM